MKSWTVDEVKILLFLGCAHARCLALVDHADLLLVGHGSYLFAALLIVRCPDDNMGDSGFYSWRMQRVMA